MSDTFIDHISRLPHRTRTLARGELVFERDDAVESLFVVTAGEVHLLRFHINGAHIILQRAGPGGILAEASVKTDEYHCSAMAVSPATVAVYSRRNVRALMDRDPTVADALTSHLAAEVRRARMKVEILSLKKVADRLDAWLIWNDGLMPDKGDWHYVAKEIGVSPEALYRELARRR